MNYCRRLVTSLIVTLTLCLITIHPLKAAQQDQQRDLKKVSVPSNIPSSEMFGESHALIFGVSDYDNGLKPLPGVKDDVDAVSEALRRHGFTIKIVMNPTQPKFDEEIRRFISQHGLKENNRLLIYYAGHGHTVESPAGAQGYLVPVNAPNPDQDESGFINAAISFDMIQVYARMIRSKYALFVFDSCFSGSLFDVRGNTGPPPPITSILGLPIRQFITSGSAKQTVADRSIFCRQFAEALKGAADITHDGYITGTELGIYLHDTVTAYTANAKGKPMQTPQYGKLRDPYFDKGDFIFALRNTPSPSGRKKQIAVLPFDLSLGNAGSEIANPPYSTKQDLARRVADKLINNLMTLKTCYVINFAEKVLSEQMLGFDERISTVLEVGRVIGSDAVIFGNGFVSWDSKDVRSNINATFYVINTHNGVVEMSDNVIGSSINSPKQSIKGSSPSNNETAQVNDQLIADVVNQAVDDLVRQLSLKVEKYVSGAPR